MTPDTTRPTLVVARNLGLTQVEVTFSEPLAAPSATTAANYRIEGLDVTGAAFGASPHIVLLTTSPLTLGIGLHADRQRRAGRRRHAQHDSRRLPVYLHRQRSSRLRTSAARRLAGAATPVPGGVDVRGSGDFGGTADALQFAWQQRTGDFDVRARLADFDPTDPFAKAGSDGAREL